MADNKHTAEQVIDAIKGSGGIKLSIARRLGVHRNTVSTYIARWASVRVAYEDEVESVGDLAESVIIKAINKEDVQAAQWYARMKLKSRGYVDRQEVTGADGGDVRIVVKVRDDDND